MADKQVTELPAATPLSGTELLHVVQGGNSRRAFAQAFADLAGAAAFPDMTGQAGNVLRVNAGEDGTEWADAGALALATETGVNRDASASDIGALVQMDNAAANTLTIPAGIAQAGAQIHVEQIGAGQTSIVAGTGVTVNTAATLKLRARFSVATLICKGGDVWTLTGDLEAAP